MYLQQENQLPGHPHLGQHEAQLPAHLAAQLPPVIKPQVNKYVFSCKNEQIFSQILEI